MHERKSSYYEFSMKKTLILWIPGSKRDLFQRWKLVERSFLSIYETCMIFWELRQMIFQFSKNDKMIFSVAWNPMFIDNWKVLVLNFPEMEIRSFFKSKSWWKDDIYWFLEGSCFELFGDGKYGLFLAKKLMERLYLLITEKFLFWTFRREEIWSFFEPKS